MRALRVGLEQQRAHGRTQGQGDETGDDRRRGDGHRELPEELAGNAGDEGRGNEHGAEHKGDGDEGAADFVHGAVRGLARRHAAADIALHILHHHDRVIDDDADGQHQAEQRQVVERVAERGEDRKCADQRHGNGDDGNDRGAPGLQEQDHHQDDQSDRLENRLDDLADGLGDELGRVIDDVVAQALRKRRRQIHHRRLDVLRRFQRVGARPLEDEERHRRQLVEITVGVVALCRKLHPGDVADTGHAPVGIGLDDDVGELALIDQPAQRFDAELEGARVRHRRLIERA